MRPSNTPLHLTPGLAPCGHALADGSLPADEIKDRLGAEKARKTALQAELTKLEQLAGIASLDTAHLKRTLREKVSDVMTLLGNHSAPDAPEALTGKIELEPVGRGRERGFRFWGALCIPSGLASSGQISSD